jgi:GNAT superfamily N-acetyltransferase
MAMTSAVSIRILASGEARGHVAALSDVLIDCVEGGDSVSFMAPLSRAKADAFWIKTAAAVEAGDRILIVALLDGQVVGTVQIILDLPENQPHRADIAKMLVHRKARRRGIGQALLQAAENAALAVGRTLLVLDTASADAERLYLRQQWTPVGEIPGYALFPDGRPCATVVFYKTLTAITHES